MLGVGTRQHAHEAGTAGLVSRQGQCRTNERAQYFFQAGIFFRLHLRRSQTLLVERVQTPAENLVDEIFLGAEMIIDRRQIHVRRRGDLAQGGASESVPGEQRLAESSIRCLVEKCGTFKLASLNPREPLRLTL